MSLQKITLANAKDRFYLEPLSAQSKLQGFKCAVDEYTDYLFKDSIRSLSDHIAKKWLYP